MCSSVFDVSYKELLVAALSHVPSTRPAGPFRSAGRIQETNLSVSRVRNIVSIEEKALAGSRSEGATGGGSGRLGFGQLNVSSESGSPPQWNSLILVATIGLRESRRATQVSSGDLSGLEGLRREQTRSTQVTHSRTPARLAATLGMYATALVRARTGRSSFAHATSSPALGVQRVERTH